MELNKEELKTVIEALIFTASADVCIESEKFNAELAVNLASRLNDTSINLGCYLYKGSDEYYEEALSDVIEELIPQIRVDKGPQIST